MDHNIKSRCLGLAWAAICLCLAVLPGCIQAGPTPEPATIAFAHFDLDTAYFERLAAAFQEAHPHITVNLQPKTLEQWARLSPDEADVFLLPSTDAFARMQEQGKLIDLTGFVEQDEAIDLSDLYPGAAAFYTVEGKTWALPAVVDPLVMYYNKDLFDQYGVAYPQNGWTWQDFLQTGLALRDPEANAFGYAARELDPLWFVYQHGGQILDDWQRPTRTTFDDPLTVEALEWYASLVHEYGIAPSRQGAYAAFAGNGSAEIGFLQGRVGMLTGHLYEQGGTLWGREWPMRWGMVTLPRDERAATLAVGFAYAISAQAPYPKACWEWIAFLSGQMPSWGIPARRSLAGSADYEAQAGPEAAAAARASMEGAMFPFFTRDASLRAIENFVRAVDYVVNQDMPPQEALDWAQRTAPSSAAQ